MKGSTWAAAMVAGTLMAAGAAAEIFVCAATGDDARDGTTWAAAKRTLQAGVDAARPGDVVWATNGVYDAGGRATPGHRLWNRLVVTRDVEVRSVNGPAATIIRGRGPRGPDAVRGVYMTAGALIGFTVENGHTRLDGDGSYDRNGGGINMYPSRTAVVSNCVIRHNRAHDSAGTTWGTLYNCIIVGNEAERASGGAGGSGTLYNCAIYGNEAGYYGGGSDQCELYNCTIVGNRAANGGGVYNCRVYNGIVVGNSPANAAASRLQFTATWPAQPGEGNVALDPMLASPMHLAPDSPCVGAGHSSYARGVDIEGRAWRDPPSMGCHEPETDGMRGELRVAVVPSRIEVEAGREAAFSVQIEGSAVAVDWSFGDGATVSGATAASHAWSAPGVYEVVATVRNDSYPDGVSGLAEVQVSGGRSGEPLP